MFIIILSLFLPGASSLNRKMKNNKRCFVKEIKIKQDLCPKVKSSIWLYKGTIYHTYGN